MIDRIHTNETNRLPVKHNNKKESFKGPGTAALAGLRLLSNSPAIGACAVDLCSMVIPRTYIEWKNRGTQSGIETLIREGTSNFIHTCVGLIGLGAAIVMSGKFNNEYGIKAQKIFASGETIDAMSKVWEGAQGQKKQFFEGIVQNIKGLNGSQWNTVSNAAKDDIVNGMVSLADKTKEIASAKGDVKKQLAEEIKDLRNLITAKVIKDTGAQASFKLNSVNGSKEIASSFTEMMDNAVSLSNSFASDKAKSKLPEFINALKNNKTFATVLGMAICVGLCASVQPINRLLTKKRTGSDGFVGVDNSDKAKNQTEEKGKIKPYQVAKTVLGIAFPLAAIRTIGKFPNLAANLQFNSKVPRLNQFKFIYGFTIASRFMSARDGNELRESVIKDSLGFTNWLILGGMVSKLTARAIGGKELINNPVAQDGAKKGLKYGLKWITQSSVKSFDEVLLPKAKEIAKNGKILGFKDLYKNADAATKTQIKKIAGSQIAGYLYSGLVLGVGIAKLNIAITRHVNARRKAKDKMKNDVINNVPQNQLDLGFLAELKQSSPVFKDFN